MRWYKTIYIYIFYYLKGGFFLLIDNTYTFICLGTHLGQRRLRWERERNLLILSLLLFDFMRIFFIPFIIIIINLDKINTIHPVVAEGDHLNSFSSMQGKEEKKIRHAIIIIIIRPCIFYCHAIYMPMPMPYACPMPTHASYPIFFVSMPQ